MVSLKASSGFDMKTKESQFLFPRVGGKVSKPTLQKFTVKFLQPFYTLSMGEELKIPSPKAIPLSIFRKSHFGEVVLHLTLIGGLRALAKNWD